MTKHLYDTAKRNIKLSGISTIDSKHVLWKEAAALNLANSFFEL